MARPARLITLALTLALAGGAARAQQPLDAAALSRAVRAWREAHEVVIVRELAELLAIPNVASDRPNIRRNAEHLVALLGRRGLASRVLDNGDAPPAVYGELVVPGASRTIVFYAHYDGQPVDPARWAGEAWRPVLRDRPLEAGGRELPLPVGPSRLDPEARLYARSSSDDKAPIVALAAALDALRAAGVPPSVNLKVFLEGEEEAGSAHTRALLVRHAGLLRADAWIFGDGPVHQTRRPQIVLGVRGVMGLELTVYGPTRPLHSGHYGNWAPNPALLLAHLIASLRDPDGGITIEGFGDEVRPLTTSELEALRGIPPVDAELRSSLGLAATEASNALLAERLMLPALNVRGIEAGRTGALAANAIPTEARASIDFRLVPDQRPERVRELVEAHLARRGFVIVTQDPDAATRARLSRIVKLEWEGGYPAQRTSLDAPAARAVVRVLEAATGRPLIVQPTSGGSLPLHFFSEVLGVPLISVPIVNHDNNQHAANENLRLQNLWDGIEAYAALLAWLGREWGAAP